MPNRKRLLEFLFVADFIILNNHDRFLYDLLDNELEFIEQEPKKWFKLPLALSLATVLHYNLVENVPIKPQSETYLLRVFEKFLQEEMLYSEKESFLWKCDLIKNGYLEKSMDFLKRVPLPSFPVKEHSELNTPRTHDEGQSSILSDGLWVQRYANILVSDRRIS